MSIRVRWRQLILVNLHDWQAIKQINAVDDCATKQKS